MLFIENRKSAGRRYKNKVVRLIKGDCMWEEIERILKSMWDNHDFILGVKLHLPTEENKKEMLDAIKSGWVKTPDDAVIYSMAIYEDAPFED